MTSDKSKPHTGDWPCQKCGWCCETIPIKTELVDKNRHLFQRPVKKIVIPGIFSGEYTIVYTDIKGGKCVFLTTDNVCAIYTDRPEVCRIFGLSGGEYECPNVAPDGRIRSHNEAKRAKIRIYNRNVEEMKEITQRTGIDKNSLWSGDSVLR